MGWTGACGCQVKLSSLTMKVSTALEAGGFMDPLKWKLLRRLTAKAFGSALEKWPHLQALLWLIRSVTQVC